MPSLKEFLLENDCMMINSSSKRTIRLNESEDLRYKTINNSMITFQFGLILKSDTVIITLTPKTHRDLELIEEMEDKDTLDVFVQGIENNLTKKLKIHVQSRTSHDSSVLHFEIMRHVLADYIFNTIK
jgi:hypothetical protein